MFVLVAIIILMVVLVMWLWLSTTVRRAQANEKAPSGFSKNPLQASLPPSRTRAPPCTWEESKIRSGSRHAAGYRRTMLWQLSTIFNMHVLFVRILGDSNGDASQSPAAGSSRCRLL